MAARSKGTGGSTPHMFRGKYAPEDFIIPGQDAQGNSVRVWCRIMPLLDRAVDILFASRKFPFKSKGDLIRWCIKVGVDRLDDMEPCVGSILAQAEAMMAALRDEQLNHSFVAVFETMASTVGAHVQAQAIGEARRVVTMMQSHIDRMEPGYWRDRYSRELDTRFGYLLRGAAGASLGQHTDSGPGPAEDDDDD